ncbi:hypothetical protein EUGRSUZ_G01266 [Eucalyptus grandis]|uniref:Uncharacterized protein n=2 Tax=Eucalyptus grandis TaxID=71139 RepID=A0ACC3K2B7_EUCGR|nr:hypothetical protein EUGRSUZ_G01266 [Eucalyptus grandis]
MAYKAPTSSSFAASVSRAQPISTDEGEDELLHGAESGWVEARTWCDHLASLSSDLIHIPTPDTPCNRCHHPSRNWLCLCCKEVLCSRYVNKHMLQHYQQTSHCLALGFSDLSVWCFSCNSFINAQVVPQLRPVYDAAYILKFGEPPLVWNVELQNVIASSMGKDELLNVTVSGRVEAQTWCGHLASLSSDLLRIPSPDTPCNRCCHPSGNWLCLCCKEVLCSRYVNKHMLQHYQQTSHCLALGFSDLSVWCFSCNSYINAQVVPQLRPVYEAAYILKFGEPSPVRTVELRNVIASSTGKDELLNVTVSGRVEAQTWCGHLASLSSDLLRIPSPDTPCNRCRHPSGNWLCLRCKEVLCSRFVNKHMLQHFQKTMVPELRPVYEAAYILKFGEPPPIRNVELRNVTASSKGEDELLNIAVSGRVEARTWCGHLASLSSDLLHIPSPDTCCNRCRHPSGNWLCLRCKEVLCSRFVNKHMLQHFQQTSHCLTLGFSDLSVWCFSCNSYINAQVVPELRPVYEAAYILKFGEPPPIRNVELRNVTASSKGEDELLNIAVSGRVEARTWCGHLASLSSDLLHVRSQETPCNRLVCVLDQTPAVYYLNYSVTYLVSLMY